MMLLSVDKQKIFVLLLCWLLTIKSYELRLKKINLSNNPSVIKLPGIDLCPHYPSLMPTTSTASMVLEINLYSYPEYLKQTKGYLFTAYKSKTICSKGFWGGIDKTVTQDFAVDLALLDQRWLNETITEWESKIAGGFKQTINFDSLNPEDRYDCSWWSTHEKELYLLRASVVDVRWKLDKTLLQPLREEKCKRKANSGHCFVGSHSVLIYPSVGFTDSCDLVPLNLLTVMATVDESKEHLVLNSIDHEFSLAVSISPRLDKELMCSDHDRYIYSSVSGHLLSFTFKNQFIQMFSIVGYLADYKINRPKRSIESHLVGNLTILSEPPKLDSLVTNPNNSRRQKRSSIWNYPEYQRINYLEEKISSGFSRVSAAVNTNIGENQYLLLSQKYDRCQVNMKFRALANLGSSSSYLAAAWALEDYQIHVIGRKHNRIWVVPGTLISKINLPSDPLNAQWCNHSILVSYYYPDNPTPYRGWLRPSLGLIYDDGVDNKCVSKDIPEDFLIPTYQHGSWDYFKNRLSHNTSIPKNRQFILNFILETPDNGESMLNKIELMNSFYPEGRAEQSYMDHIWHSIRTPSQPSLLGTSLLVSHFLTPGIIICSGVVLILLLLKIRCVKISKDQSHATGFF